MNSFRNLSDFPSEDVLLLQVYDLLKKTDVATFRHKEAVNGQESLICDEISLNLRNFQMSSTQRNTLVRLESSLVGRHWNIWVDSIDYLYAGDLTSLVRRCPVKPKGPGGLFHCQQQHFGVTE